MKREHQFVRMVSPNQHNLLCSARWWRGDTSTREQKVAVECIPTATQSSVSMGLCLPFFHIIRLSLDLLHCEAKATTMGLVN